MDPAGATAGAGGAEELAPYEYDDGDATLDAAPPFDTLDKYDALLPIEPLFTCEFGDQLVIEYDFFGVDAATLLTADTGAAWLGDQLVIEYDFFVSPVDAPLPERFDM